ncbi:MAG: hypothetical protein KC766_34620 [Myxococcales bacterium]|nr:hypothetical protein [Myxococcales bacterium]
MSATYATFEGLKRFLGFADQDAENLKSLAPIFDRLGPGITDAFYEALGRNPDTAKFLEGRVDQLKRTHQQWMQELFAGEYAEAYFDSRMRIGLAHVRIGLAAYWVEAVMSVIRSEGLKAMAREIGDADELASKAASLARICDLDLAIINLSYGEDRLDRLSEFTGMKRALIENIISIPRKTA